MVDQARRTSPPPLKTTLIGPPPFSRGKVGGLTPAKRQHDHRRRSRIRPRELNPAAGANPRAILLMTDGLQNEGLAAGRRRSLRHHRPCDRIRLAIPTSTARCSCDLATTHGGRYLRAGGGLTLEKFFSDAFGNIFENGIIHDPEFDLPANQSGAKTPFRVCGEDAITLVAAGIARIRRCCWKSPAPAGRVITSATPSVQSSARAGRGRSCGSRCRSAASATGCGTCASSRPGGGGEFPPPTPALRYFINVIPTGGPVMSRMPGYPALLHRRHDQSAA